jgi:hypothetical protein
MSKYYYERSKFSEFQSNRTYHQLLEMTDDEFINWAKLLRKEVTKQWDEDGVPPVIGKDKAGIIESFKKLKGNDCDFLQKDLTGDDESLGIIQNFNKDASAINQFFPTMLKTKISIGKTADGGLSIYDHFSDPNLEDVFVKIMRRAVKRDSMYSWSRSIVNKKDENEFWDGETGVEFIQKAYEGKIFVGKHSNLDIVIAKVKEDTIDNYGTINEQYIGFGNLYLNAEQLQGCVDKGWLSPTQMSNVKAIEDSITLADGKTIKKFYYLIRWYDKTVGIFPKILQVFRLSCGQPAVNFPALTAKWIYEHFTSHIEQDEPLHIYDSSSGWGGRILGAMSTRKKTHYVGTDPNPDNFIPELGISRYEYAAKFYNDNCVDDFSESFTKFFDVEKQGNTYELFQDGSELIQHNPKFQKYKGKLDLSFTSPPYFNREQYSQDENQSFKAYGEYDDWRDNFLRPTLTTIYEYTKNDRYVLWNIADIKIGKDTYYALEKDSIDILKELGCEYKGKLKMLMTRMVGLDPTKTGIKNAVKHDGKAYKFEPIFVFYKP